MEKRNVATERRVREEDATDRAIATAASCIGKVKGIIKNAKEDIDRVRISMESMKKAMEEDEKAEKEG